MKPLIRKDQIVLVMVATSLLSLIFLELLVLLGKMQTVFFALLILIFGVSISIVMRRLIFQINSRVMILITVFVVAACTGAAFILWSLFEFFKEMAK